MSVNREKAGDPPELRGYMDKLWQRLPAFARRTVIPPGDQGSVEWLGATGQYWWREREEMRMSQKQAAEALGIDIGELRLSEHGVTEPETWLGDFPRRYAEILQKPELYDQFCRRFNIPKFDPNNPIN